MTLRSLPRTLKEELDRFSLRILRKYDLWHLRLFKLRPFYPGPLIAIVAFNLSFFESASLWTSVTIATGHVRPTNGVTLNAPPALAKRNDSLNASVSCDQDPREDFAPSIAQIKPTKPPMINPPKWAPLASVPSPKRSSAPVKPSARKPNITQ